MYSLRMRTDCISFLLMMMKISAYACFLSARNIGNHLMSLLLLMNVWSELLVYVQTMNHRPICLVVLEVVWYWTLVLLKQIITFISFACLTSSNQEKIEIMFGDHLLLLCLLIHSLVTLLFYINSCSCSAFCFTSSYSLFNINWIELQITYFDSYWTNGKASQIALLEIDFLLIWLGLQLSSY